MNTPQDMTPDDEINSLPTPRMDACGTVDEAIATGIRLERELAFMTRRMMERTQAYKQRDRATRRELEAHKGLVKRLRTALKDYNGSCMAVFGPRKCKDCEATVEAGKAVLDECQQQMGPEVPTVPLAVFQACNRLRVGMYYPWQGAGGPDECPHGIAAGIFCVKCDLETVERAMAAVKPLKGTVLTVEEVAKP